MFDLAKKENRIISNKEAKIRKGVGIFFALVMIVVLICYSPSRSAYGPVSLVFAAAIGTFRTGQQGLWGCSINLKVNVDGNGFKNIADEHLDWMKAKRRELGMLGFTTLVGVLIATFAIALIVEKGDFTSKHAVSILVWNISGGVAGAILSAAARWNTKRDFIGQFWIV